MLMLVCVCSGDLAVNDEDRARAHFSLPQPLHLRMVCVCDSGSASIRVEQVRLWCGRYHLTLLCLYRGTPLYSW